MADIRELNPSSIRSKNMHLHDTDADAAASSVHFISYRYLYIQAKSNDIDKVNDSLWRRITQYGISDSNPIVKQY